jgi:hypothetical protein
MMKNYLDKGHHLLNKGQYTNLRMIEEFAKRKTAITTMFDDESIFGLIL